MPTDATIEESSTSEATQQVTEATPIKDLKAYTRDEYKEWQKTGKLAEEQVTAEEPEPKETSVTESESEPDKKPHKKKNAEDRKAELAAEIQDLLKQRSELRREREQPEPKKDVKADSSPKAEGRPVKPKIEDFDDFGKYEDAKDAYYEELADWKADQKVKTFEEKQQADAKTKKLAEKWDLPLKEARAEFADFDLVAFSPELLEIVKNRVISDAIEESEHGAKLLYRLGEDIADTKRIAGLSPMAAARELIALEAEINPKGQGKTKEPITITRAPKPPSRHGSTTPTTDPSEAALRAGDFRAYQDAENAKERARRRG